MLKINLHAAIVKQNIANPRQFLIRKAGINPETASNLLAGNVKAFRLSYMSALCKLLHCTPNDLLEWEISASADELPENHPLNELMNKQEEKRLVQAAMMKIAAMSADELRAMVEEKQ